MILKAEAIVLKTFDFRETSKIATFFTREHGKVKGILKGIRADHKKFGSSLDTFSVNDIVYYYHRHSEIHLVSQCDLKNYFFPIRKDIKSTTAAQYILELVDAIMPLEQENNSVYDLMMEYLTSLEAPDDISKLVHMFQIKLLHLSGFRPHLDSCVVCDKKVADRARFSSTLGGLVCPRCQSNDTAAIPISKGAVASLLHVERNAWKGCLRLGLARPVKRELKYILNTFLTFHVERKLKSEKFINRI